MNADTGLPWPGSRTRLLGLIGHPVAHSLSPRFQNAALRAAGLDACYLAFDVPPSALPASLMGARALGFAGLNVTVPHKEEALRLADEVDARARLVGAANTLVPTEAGWKAFNTDVDGFLRAVADDLSFQAGGRRALIVGAGGAARAAAVGLLETGIQEIWIANRNIERAESLAVALANRTDAVPIRPLRSGDPLPTGLGPGDLVVDATPAGLKDEQEWPWRLAELGAGFLVYDMAYRSASETPLVAAARTAGLRAASGRRMLLHQGAAAFTLWTGLRAPIEIMERALLE